MKKIDKATEILQAFKEGKTIQYKIGVTWLSIANEAVILEYLSTGEYPLRVKPEQECRYRPYDNAEEFLKDSKMHGPYINDDYLIKMPYSISNTSILLLNSEESFLVNYGSLLKLYKWQDGSPCGIIKE